TQRIGAQLPNMGPFSCLLGSHLVHVRLVLLSSQIVITVTGRVRLGSPLLADTYRNLILAGRLLTPRGVHTHDLSCADTHLRTIEGTHTHCLVQCLHLTVGRLGGHLWPLDVEAVSPNHVSHIGQSVVHHFLTGDHCVDCGLVQCLVHSAGPSLTGV